MRGKIIKAFIGIYLALSMVYGGIRAAYLTVAATMTPPEASSSLAAEPSFGRETITAQPSQVPTLPPTPTTDPSVEPEPSTAPAEIPSPSESPAAEPAPAPEPAEALTESPAEEDQDASLEAAPAPEAPSLEDYLSQLHCGGCGRNCLLSSPRCRTGNRKAETYTAEYYTEYGTTGDA